MMKGGSQKLGSVLELEKYLKRPPNLPGRISVRCYLMSFISRPVFAIALHYQMPSTAHSRYGNRAVFTLGLVSGFNVWAWKT